MEHRCYDSTMDSNIMRYPTRHPANFMTIIPYTNTGGQPSKYYITLSGDSTLIPTTTTKLQLEFPAEFDLAPNPLTCKKSSSGFSVDPLCSIVSPNVVEISTTTMTFPFTYFDLDVDTLKNPIVESGPFSIKLTAVATGSW